mmetsp:Transcript_31206/g.56605  ORF Transcript_31206/g.56605 Transcript_31206/m.56605 type:complete len:507 (-) Transcript_31206:284-1804(-)
MVSPVIQGLLLLVLCGSSMPAAGEDVDKCKATHGSTLMQVQSEVGKFQAGLLARASAKQADGAGQRATELARQFREEPTNIAEALKRGLEGIHAATIHFFQADIAAGISSLGEALLECLSLVITEEGVESWPQFEDFRDTWIQTFNDFTSTLDGIKEELESFAKTGDVKDLIAALSQILSHSSDLVLDSLPGDLAPEISGYLEALNKAFASVGDVIIEFENGDILAGVGEVYFGLRNATEHIIPENIRNDATYTTIIGLLDIVVGGISQDILDYKRRIMESNTCWKVAQSRSRRLPKHCPSGYIYDGERHCWPKTAAKCWQMAPDCASSFTYRGDHYENCTGVHHHTHWCSHNEAYKMGQWSDCEEIPCEASLLALDRATAHKMPKGTIPARCDDSDESQFPEKNGGWCYADCPAGYGPSGARCWTQCEGTFPAESPLICGRDPLVLGITITEMVTVTLHSAFSLASVIASMQTAGVNVANLGSTIHILINMGQPFALLKCSEISM